MNLFVESVVISYTHPTMDMKILMNHPSQRKTKIYKTRSDISLAFIKAFILEDNIQLCKSAFLFNYILAISKFIIYMKVIQ